MFLNPRSHWGHILIYVPPQSHKAYSADSEDELLHNTPVGERDSRLLRNKNVTRFGPVPCFPAKCGISSFCILTA